MAVEITVAIPFHGKSPFLADAVRSVLNQSFQNFELLLFCDGANDAAITIVESFDDRRVRLINDGKNLGLARRLNQVAETASGAFVARMDSDDIMHPDRLRIQKEFLESNHEVNVVGSHAYAIDTRSMILGICKVRSGYVPKVELQSGPPFVHPSVMMRAEWLRNNRYDAFLRRTEDKELWIRGWQEGSFFNLEERLLFYRLGERQGGYVIAQTEKEERLLYRRYLDGTSSVRMQAKSYVKQFLKLGIEFASGSRVLQGRRYLEVNSREKEEAELALMRAVRHAVIG